MQIQSSVTEKMILYCMKGFTDGVVDIKNPGEIISVVSIHIRNLYNNI